MTPKNETKNAVTPSRAAAFSDRTWRPRVLRCSRCRLLKALRAPVSASCRRVGLVFALVPDLGSTTTQGAPEAHRTKALCIRTFLLRKMVTEHGPGVSAKSSFHNVPRSNTGRPGGFQASHPQLRSPRVTQILSQKVAPGPVVTPIFPCVTPKFVTHHTRQPQRSRRRQCRNSQDQHTLHPASSGALTGQIGLGKFFHPKKKIFCHM